MIIVPVYLPYYVIAGTIAMIAAILFGLSKALNKSDWVASGRVSAARTSALVLIGWFLVATSLAWIEAYRAAPDRIPTIQYGIFVPILIGGLLIWRSSTLARIIDAVPQHWLIGVQLYRALGAIFLILYATGKLPGLFAWPAGLGDVLVGVLAPVVAVAYARAPRKNSDLVAAWNVFGLADLVIAVTTGFSRPLRRCSYLPSICQTSSLASFRWCLFRSSSCRSRYSSIWRSWQSCARVPYATTTVAKSHALRRDAGLLAPQSLES